MGALLFPVLFVLYAMLALVGSKKEEQHTSGFLTGLIVATLLLLVGYTVAGVVNHAGEYFTYGTFLELLLPILLTMGLIPFAYLLALVTSYGNVERTINFKLDPHRDTRRHAKWRSVAASRGRLSRMRALEGFPWKITPDATKTEIDAAIKRSLGPRPES